MKRILGLDIGETLGWCIIEADKKNLELIGCGEIADKAGDAPSVPRLIWVLEALDLFNAGKMPVSTYKIGSLNALAVEALLETKGARPTHCPKLAYWIEGTVRIWAEETGIEYYSYHPATVKAAFGAKDKSQVRQAVQHWLGLEITKKADHASDACAVALLYAMREVGWTPPEGKPLVYAPKREIQSRKREALGKTLDEVDINTAEGRKLLDSEIKAGRVKIKKR